MTKLRIWSFALRNPIFNILFYNYFANYLKFWYLNIITKIFNLQQILVEICKKYKYKVKIKFHY